MGRSQRLYEQAKRLIPGGTQLLSKRPEMFLPDRWPAYYSRAKGCSVWDLDGKRYTDMSNMGVGSCILGYADPDVVRAVKNAVDNGNMATLNAPEEVELARLLISLHPWAQMVRYARTGGEAMAQAARIARASSGKDVILFCGYHGWHDWYLASNLGSTSSLDGHLLPGLEPRGVPRALKGTSIPFVYNDTASFLSVVKKYGNKIGGVIIEPIRYQRPDRAFLDTIRDVTYDMKVPLVFDEITIGWRLCLGGAHKMLGVEPDIAVFAKALGNGFPMAAIIGKRSIMNSAQVSFISSTYWTDRIGPAAAIATIKKLKDKDAPAHLARVGRMVQEGWEKAAAAHGIEIEVAGEYPLGHFSFKHAEPLVLKTLYTQQMLKEGFLAVNAFYASYGHKNGDVDRYGAAADRAFRFIARAVRSGDPSKFLDGPVCHSGFKRIT